MVTVVWDAAECMTLVDRSRVSEGLTLGYALPAESPLAGESKCEDEAEESRTIQFIAFCGDPWHPRASRIYTSDVDASTLPPQAVLETSDACWSEITGADTRRPMQFEAHQDPLVWNLDDVEAGTYSIWSFSLVPPFFVWLRRDRNIVKIHDGDPHAVGPALAITNDEAIIDLGETVTIEGCIHALPGSTLHGEFSTWPEPSWTSFVQDVPVEGGSFSVPFVPPEGSTFNIRITATDPQGRTSVAYSPATISVIDAEGTCEEGANFLPCPPVGSSSSSGTSSSSSSSAGETDAGSADDSGSSGCNVGGGLTPLPVLVLLGAYRRRRR